VVAGAKVKLGEEFGSTELAQQLINYWYWKFIFHRLLIQGTVVNTEAPRIVRFLDKKHWGREG